MPYSNENDLYYEYDFVDLNRISGSADDQVLDIARVLHAIEMGDAVIDGFLFGRYDVPFNGTIDPLIRKLSIDLAIANLFEYEYSKTGMPNTIVWRRINALRLLKDIQEGKVTLKGSSPGTNSPPPIVSNKTAADKYFSAGLMNRFNDKP